MLRRAQSLGWVVLLALACAAPTPEQQVVEWRESAVSLSSWERVRPYLEALQPGGNLDLFADAREIHVRKRPKLPPVVVIPSWITSLSGGAAGGLSMFGQLVGRVGNRVHGSHVFGTVVGDRIVPRYQVFMEAVLIERDEYRRLAKGGVPGIGAIPRPAEVLFFQDLYVAGGRPLHFPDLSQEAVPALAVEAFHSQDAYAAGLAILEELPEGTDLLSLLLALEASFLSSDLGESHSLRARGFLHTGSVRTRTLESPQGLYKLRPFGWMEGETEVIERIAIFENDRLLRVVAHRGLDDWTIYLREVLEAR